MVYGRRVQSQDLTWWYTVKSHLQLWYVTASSSLKMGKLIFMWAPVSLCCLLHQECQEPSDLSDCDDTDKAVDTELLSLLNPWSSEGESGWGCISLWSPQHWSQSRPLCGLQGNGQWSKLAFPECSFWGESSEWWNWNGWAVNGWEHGPPGPLASIWPSVMAWAIAHLPSCMVKESAAGYADLPTQVPAPVSVDTTSLASPKLRPFCKDCLPSKRTAQPCLSLQLQWDLLCHCKACPPLQVPSKHEMVEVSLASITCIPRQCQVSGWQGDSFLTGDQDGEWEGSLPNAPISSGSSWPLDGMGEWPSVWRLAPGVQLSKLLDLVAIDVTVVAVNWNPSSICTIQAQRPLQEIKNPGFALTASFTWWLGFWLLATNGLPHRHGDTSNLGKGSYLPS